MVLGMSRLKSCGNSLCRLTVLLSKLSPLEFYHGKFMYDVALVEPDAHSIAPISSLERIKPMNDVLSGSLIPIL